MASAAHKSSGASRLKQKSSKPRLEGAVEVYVLSRPGPSSQSELESVASHEHPAGRVSIEEPGEEPFERHPLAQSIEVHAFLGRLTLEPV
jgi:hypothetical protein